MNDHWPYDTVTVTGPDALTYLHSQLSQDLRGLAAGTSTWSFVLEPTGRIDALVSVHRTAEESFELHVDLGWGDGLIARLNKFRIRVKADVVAGSSHTGDPTAYLADRVRAGWPAMGAEITEASIPGEFPHVVQAAVSFSKGCYPGQELVERMDSRAAKAPRRLVLVRLPSGTQPGDDVLVADEQVGTVTSAVADGDGVLALALVRRGVDVPDELSFAG